MMLLTLNHKFVLNDLPKKSVFSIVCEFESLSRRYVLMFSLPLFCATQYTRMGRSTKISWFCSDLNRRTGMLVQIFLTNFCTSFSLKDLTKLSVKCKDVLQLASKFAVEIFRGRFNYQFAHPFHLSIYVAELVSQRTLS